MSLRIGDIAPDFTQMRAACARPLKDRFTFMLG